MGMESPGLFDALSVVGCCQQVCVVVQGWLPLFFMCFIVAGSLLLAISLLAFVSVLLGFVLPLVFC
jgi:hypothetical protein